MRRVGTFFFLVYVMLAMHTCLAGAAALSVDRDIVHLTVGSTTQLSVSDPDVTVTWKSSRKKVARVEKTTGVIQAVGTGRCTVTGTSLDGDTVEVTVCVYKKEINAAKKNGLTLIGHRGDTDRYPENSLLGIRSTIQNGWNGAEVDVYYTDSKDFLCFHDVTLSRLCGVSDMRIYDVTAENRFDYPLLSRNEGDEISYIPTVAEVLKAMSETKNGILYLHIKTMSSLEKEDVAKLSRIIRRYGMKDRVVIFGADCEALQRFVKRGYACGITTKKTTLKGMKRMVRKCKNQKYQYLFAFNGSQLSKAIVDYAHARGIKIGLYKTLTSSQLMWLQDIGADFSMLYRNLTA